MIDKGHGRFGGTAKPSLLGSIANAIEDIYKNSNHLDQEKKVVTFTDSAVRQADLMRPYYFSSTTNFGDHMNSWLWSRILPGIISADSEVRLIGIGSLLRNDIARLAGTKVIFGTGSGYGDLPLKETSKSWKFYCVRGPLTAKNFNLDISLAIVDAAWLINLLPEFSTIPSRKSGISFIPHWTSAIYGNWRPVCDLANINYINPMDNSFDVIKRIANSELAIVESLHGAIVADYFRTPWIPVDSAGTGRVLHFKWLDWCMSVDVPYSSIELPPSDYLDFLAQHSTPKIGPIGLRTREFSVDEFPYREITVSSQNNSIYKIRQRLIAKAHGIRNATLDQLKRVRDVPPMSSWNANHREELVKFLTNVAARQPFLSSDKIRQRKIDQLNSTLDQLKKDYS